jgi:glycosyltransferase involved in cell wall biosynthesis
MQISVCIATFNGAKYINAQLSSILKQLGKDDEVIISDDSSTDDTIALIEQLNDSRIKLFIGNRFQSPILNFENAISKASGQYIFLSDQDDEWAPDKINQLLPLLQQKKLAVSYFSFIDKDSKIIPATIRNKPSKYFLVNLIRPSIPGCCMAFRSELKNNILPFPKGIGMHDWWIALVAGIHGQIAILPVPLVKIRRHESNFSSTGSKSKMSLKRKLSMRYFILKKLVLYLWRSKNLR